MGWAPTADTLALAENKCTKQRFSGYTIVQPTVDTGQPPRPGALFLIRNGPEKSGKTYGKYWDTSVSCFCERKLGISTTSLLSSGEQSLILVCGSIYGMHSNYSYIIISISYILSDILSGTYSDIIFFLFDFLSAINSGILSEVYSDIQSGLSLGP